LEAVATLSVVGVSLPLSEIYAGVEFESGAGLPPRQ
jgi:hypothetical protein